MSYKNTNYPTDSRDSETKTVNYYTEDIEERIPEPPSFKLNFKGLLQKAKSKFGKVTKI